MRAKKCNFPNRTPGWFARLYHYQHSRNKEPSIRNKGFSSLEQARKNGQVNILVHPETGTRVCLLASIHSHPDPNRWARVIREAICEHDDSILVLESQGETARLMQQWVEKGFGNINPQAKQFLEQRDTYVALKEAHDTGRHTIHADMPTEIQDACLAAHVKQLGFLAFVDGVTNDSQRQQAEAQRLFDHLKECHGNITARVNFGLTSLQLPDMQVKQPDMPPSIAAVAKKVQIEGSKTPY
jgi:hypothetical protein